MDLNDLFDLLRLAAAFLVGTFIGSFLNVCIHRLPRNESVVHPGSRCYVCGTKVLWYDNLPILSWLLLRGRCRHCGSGFSIRYLVGELSVGLLTLLVCWWVFVGKDIAPLWSGSGGWNVIAIPDGQTAMRFLMASALLIFVYFVWVAAVIDFNHTIIPDELTKPMQFAAPLLALFVPIGAKISAWPNGWFMGHERMDGVPLWQPWYGIGMTAAITVVVLVLLVLSLPLAKWIYGNAIRQGERWRDEDHVGFRRGVLFFVAVTVVHLVILVLLGFSARSGAVIDPLALTDPSDPAAAVLPNGGAWLVTDFSRNLLGSLAGWCSLYGIGIVGTLAFRRNAMGYGDVKFLAPIGALLGPLGVVYCFFFAALIGTLVGVPLRLLGRGVEIPFGPYLAVGAGIALFAGPALSDALF